MSRRPTRSLRQLLPLGITAILVASCGRSPHSESDVVDAFAAQGVELLPERVVARRIPDAYALDEVTSVLVRPSADTESELIVRVFASAAAASRTAGSPIVDNARLRTQACELLTRSNVVTYACGGPGLALASVRAAMAALD